MRKSLMNASDYLILDLGNFRERMQTFFNTMNESDAHRKLFAEDPAGVIQRMVFPDRDLSGNQIDDANRLLFAILSNRKFMAWAQTYQKQLEDEALKTTQLEDKDEAIRVMTGLFDRHKLYTDMLHGVLANGDVEILNGVMYGVGGGPPGRLPPPTGGGSGRGGTRHPTDDDNPVLFIDSVILIESVIVVAAFILPIACIGLVANPTNGLSRQDLQKVAVNLAKHIQNNAGKVRRAGKLAP